jgi:hypothetical protein
VECGDNRPKRANYGVVCAGHGWHWLEPISRLIAPQAAEGRKDLPSQLSTRTSLQNRAMF